MKFKNDLTQGKVSTQLRNLTIPMIFGTLGTMVFNIADTYFIGQLGTLQLAAISFTFPVIMVVMSIAFGLGTGATSLISRAIGADNKELVKNLTVQSLLLSVLVVALTIILGLLTINPLFRLLGAPDSMLGMIHQYMSIWYPGMIVLIVPMVGNSAIRSTGNTKFPSMVMLVSMVVNIILDPIMIFGMFGFPRLEIAGAAIATVIARSVTLVFSLWLLNRLEMISFRKSVLKGLRKNWKALMYIGLPSAATNIINPIAIGFITALLAKEGAEAVAGYGIATRVEGFLLVVLMSLGMSLGPFAGQNWGAKKYDRVKKASEVSLKFSIAWGIFMWVLMYFFSKNIAAEFNANQRVIEIVSLYFLFAAISYGFRGGLRMSTSILSVINRPIDSACLNIIHTLILTIPFTFFGEQLFGVKGIFMGITAAYFISGSISFSWLNKFIRNKIRAV